MGGKAGESPVNPERELLDRDGDHTDNKWRKARLGGWSLWTKDELQAVRAPLFSPSVVALGTFDGVHVGHRQILETACALARRLGGTALALTFDRHPQQTLAPQRAPSLLTSFEKRLELIQSSGVRHTVVAQFDQSFANVEASDFLDHVVLRALGASAVVVGYNFRFGRGAAGDAAYLSAAARRKGFQLSIVPPVEDDGAPVSSTRIRTMLAAGDVESAARLLGRAFLLTGRVIPGDARGRTLGYPTANLAPDQGMAVPADGVYVTEISIRGRSHNGLTVIGSRPSFGLLERTVESFLLDFEGDLYDAEIEVAFLTRLRDVVKFDSVDALKEQIARDVSEAKAFFARRVRHEHR